MLRTTGVVGFGIGHGVAVRRDGVRLRLPVVVIVCSADRGLGGLRVRPMNPEFNGV